MTGVRGKALVAARADGLVFGLGVPETESVPAPKVLFKLGVLGPPVPAPAPVPVGPVPALIIRGEALETATAPFFVGFGVAAPTP